MPNYPKQNVAVTGGTWVKVATFVAPYPREVRVLCNSGADLEVLCPASAGVGIVAGAYTPDEGLKGKKIPVGEERPFTAHAQPGGGNHIEVWARSTAGASIDIDVSWA